MSLKEKLQKIKPAWWFVLVGLLLLVAAAAVWWCKLSLDPERVFWATVEQNMQTTGVTVQYTEAANNSSLEQITQFSLGAVNVAHSRTIIRDGGNVVATEVLGTPDADYTRYTAVESERRDESGQPLDFSQVLNTWAKTDAVASGELLGQALLGLAAPIGGNPMPIGNLNPEARASILSYLRDQHVYDVDFSKAQKTKKDGRTYLTYDVKIQAIAYVSLMKRFAEAVGMHQLDGLDPNNFQGQPAAEVKITIDARAKHIVSVEIAGSNFSQTFHSYDIPVATPVPDYSIPMSELQRRIDELR